MPEDALEPDESIGIAIYNPSGEIIQQMRVSREFADQLMNTIREMGAKRLLAIPLLSKETGVPERTLRGAFDRKEIPYEYVGKKVRAATVDAVEAWKNNPKFHKRGRRKVSRKSG